MKHVSILVPKGHISVVNVCAVHQIFGWVNQFNIEQGKPPIFNIQLVGLEKNADASLGMVTLHANAVIDEVTKSDLIVLPAIHSDFQKSLVENAPLIPWLKTQYKNGAEIVSLCVGSFFLAATGLLDGKSCSTHWQLAHEFRKQFPKAKLQDEKILTDENGIYTSGGAFAFTNMVIYLVEKFAGREIAVKAAKGFMIDIDRTSQSPFMLFSGQKNHKDKQVLRAQEYIEKHYQNKIAVSDLCENMALSRRTFERRFKKATANTVLEYLQRVKIEAAKKELEKGRKTVNEVMYEVGYNDPKAFRDVFKKIAGISPLKYKTKYAKTISM